MTSKKRNPQKYLDSLQPDALQRYRQKIHIINDLDPYQIPKHQFDQVLKVPQTNTTDIFNYLVLGKSAYTLEEYKNYKSMDAYKAFVAGFVGDVCSFSPPNSKYIPDLPTPRHEHQ